MHDTDRCRLGKQFQVNNYYKQYMYLYNFIIRLYVTRPLPKRVYVYATDILQEYYTYIDVQECHVWTFSAMKLEV